MMRLQSYMKGTIPFAAMVLLECGGVVMTTISKAAMNRGMNNFVFTVYYNTLGLFICLPFFIFHIYRNKPPPLTLALLFRCFILGILGKSLVLFGYIGINCSSPTLYATLSNLTPVFTFLLVIIIRVDKIDIRSSSSRAKSLGTIVAVSGAILMTFYKGAPILSATSLSIPLHQRLLFGSSNWILESLLLTIAHIFGSPWIILQASTVKKYPDQTTIVFFSLLFGTVQCAVLGQIVERNPSAWTLRPNMEVIAIVYSAVFSALICNNILTWCLNEKGPLYVSMFNPVGMIVAGIGGIIFLGDILYIGSVIGAIIIAVGFYTVMWGQAKEKDMAEDRLPNSELPSPTTPLLLNHDRQEA